MSQDSKPNVKIEDESQQDIKRTPEYRKFRKLHKQVIKAPPMRKKERDLSSEAYAQ
jgi:hypothetical protein